MEKRKFNGQMYRGEENGNASCFDQGCEIN